MFMDYNIDLLDHVLQVIDKQLEGIVLESTEIEDPDQFGYFDKAEHITGLGFVSCQWYIASTLGLLRMKKAQALLIGPLHRSGLSVVAIINHAANYWKHHGEWSINKETYNQRRIVEAFNRVGFSIGTDYPLSGILTEIVVPHEIRFAPLMKLLEIWRDELLNTNPPVVDRRNNNFP